MRNELMLTCSLLAVPLAGSMINMRPPKVMMNSLGGIRAACNDRVDTACTRFDGTTLECSCALHADRWLPQVRIDAQPRMYLSTSRYMLHELSHVFDLKQSMQLYADDIESRSFDSLDACDDFLSETREGFSDALVAFRRISMLRRDHELTNGE